MAIVWWGNGQRKYSLVFRLRCPFIHPCCAGGLSSQALKSNCGMAEQGTADDLFRRANHSLGMGQSVGVNRPILNKESIRIDAAEVLASGANAKGESDFLDGRRLCRGEHARIQVEETEHCELWKCLLYRSASRNRRNCSAMMQEKVGPSKESSAGASNKPPTYKSMSCESKTKCPIIICAHSHSHLRKGLPPDFLLRAHSLLNRRDMM